MDILDKYTSHMKMNFSRITFLLLILCSHSVYSVDSKVNLSNTTVFDEIDMSKIPINHNAPVKISQLNISKYAISALMSKPASIMKVKKQGKIFIVSYNRSNDGQSFSYKIKIIGNDIIWGNADGRWREAASDEKLSYSVKNGTIFIYIKYSDGSSETKKY